MIGGLPERDNALVCMHFASSPIAIDASEMTHENI
jgi:hypothetical protein